MQNPFRRRDLGKAETGQMQIMQLRTEQTIKAVAENMRKKTRQALPALKERRRLARVLPTLGKAATRAQKKYNDILAEVKLTTAGTAVVEETLAKISHALHQLEIREGLLKTKILASNEKIDRVELERLPKQVAKLESEREKQIKRGRIYKQSYKYQQKALKSAEKDMQKKVGDYTDARNSLYALSGIKL